MTTTYFRTARLDVRRFTTADVTMFTAYRADPDVARSVTHQSVTRQSGTHQEESR